MQTSKGDSATMEQTGNKQEPTDQPITLGQVIRQARERRGISARQLAGELHMHHSYVTRLESGAFKQASPEKLQRIAAILELNYEDLFAIAGYPAPETLPSFIPYLRAKYHLSDQDLTRLGEYFTLLRAQHGITVRKSPHASSGELNIDDDLANDIKQTVQDAS